MNSAPLLVEKENSVSTAKLNINVIDNRNRNLSFSDIPIREKSKSIFEKTMIEDINESLNANQKQAVKKLIWVSIICVFFMGAEVVGGILSNSLALLSDAVHMLTDLSGFFISFISICISRRKPSKRLTYGYHRAEVVGALVSVLMIWGFTAWIVYEGVERVISQKYEIEGLIMGIVAFIGLLANIVMGKILHQHVKD